MIGADEAEVEVIVEDVVEEEDVAEDGAAEATGVEEEDGEECGKRSATGEGYRRWGVIYSRQSECCYIHGAIVVVIGTIYGWKLKLRGVLMLLVGRSPINKSAPSLGFPKHTFL